MCHAMRAGGGVNVCLGILPKLNVFHSLAKGLMNAASLDTAGFDSIMNDSSNHVVQERCAGTGYI